MFFSIFTRGSMISWPHFWQRILKSMPTRSTSKPVGPTGVRLFGYDHITNLNVHSSTAFL